MIFTNSNEKSSKREIPVGRIGNTLLRPSSLLEHLVDRTEQPCYDVRMSKYEGYHPMHDTGMEPCSKGPCCAQRREEAILRAAAATWLDNVPDDIDTRRVADGVKGDFVPPIEFDCLIHLIGLAHVSTLSDLCNILGITRATLMRVRRRSERVERACADFMAGVFEEEVETGSRRLPASVVLAGLERLIPTYEKGTDGSLSEEDVLVIVRTVVDSIKLRVASLDVDEEERNALVHGLANDIIHAFSMRSGSE